MKKSEKLYLAMKCVVDNHILSADEKLAVLEVLHGERLLALWSEEEKA